LENNKEKWQITPILQKRFVMNKINKNQQEYIKDQFVKN